MFDQDLGSGDVCTAPTYQIRVVVCTNRGTKYWNKQNIGNLRVALNALVRLFRLRV